MRTDTQRGAALFNILAAGQADASPKTLCDLLPMAAVRNFSQELSDGWLIRTNPNLSSFRRSTSAVD